MKVKKNYIFGFKVCMIYENPNFNPQTLTRIPVGTNNFENKLLKSFFKLKLDALFKIHEKVPSHSTLTWAHILNPQTWSWLGASNRFYTYNRTLPVNSKCFEALLQFDYFQKHTLHGNLLGWVEFERKKKIAQFSDGNLSSRLKYF